MTKDEALKLALEAMERYQVKRQDFDRFAEEITALREALAEQPAQQEPVAILNHAHGIHTVRSVKLNGLPDGEYNLYTSPPAQRTWDHVMVYAPKPAQRKPLTEEEIDAIDQSMCGEREFYVAFARGIEAAHGIKEKNT